MKKPLVSILLKKIAPKIGAQVNLEPKYGWAGQIVFKNGRKRYFRASSVDLNPVGSSDIAKDKDFAAYFMGKMRYPVVTGETFFSDEWAETVGSNRNIDTAYAYAQRLGFPVIVKPNSKSQGVGVVKVYTKRDFYRAFRAALKKDRVALVQEALLGRDYRIVVLDDKVISAYERIPLNIIGDGRSTIAKLLVRKQKFFKKSGRDTLIKTDDFRIAMKLARRGLTIGSVPKKGERIFLLDNANLSTGGDSKDVTGSIHRSFATLAIRLTKDMGLRFCGVDLIIVGTIGDDASTVKYWVLEINAAPGLDHYGAIGKKQKKLVESLYLTVLKAME
ncbi:MAG: ATP-grasp enzyme, D-alanine-D-alanine ligase [Parcubacteria group bacterium Gr01-1014_17]|nr:MAG: ATP-grasp enzyme, D-alanine-D-alanine ligase [Parcubacteria group bacterium Gr01-1014_17]